MKIFIFDQLLYLIIGTAILIYIPILCGPVLTFIFEVAGILCLSYSCRRVLALPVDFLAGQATKEVYYSAQDRVVALEFFRKKYCCEWSFCFNRNNKLRLLVPVSESLEEITQMPRPPKDEVVVITYLRFSQILLYWRPTPKSDIGGQGDGLREP